MLQLSRSRCVESIIGSTDLDDVLSRYDDPMPLYELHTFTDTEVAKVTQEPGIFVLYQVENPIAAESATDLRRALVGAKSKHPRATHFATEMLAPDQIPERLRSVQGDLSRVRKSTFMGSTRTPTA